MQETTILDAIERYIRGEMLPEERVFFEELLARAPEIELCDSDPPRMRPSNFISGIEELPVRVGRPAEGQKKLSL